MSRLFVGQKVKLIAGVDAGNTGVIEFFTDEDSPWTVAVRFDNPGPGMDGETTEAGEVCLCRPFCLAPILPEGYEPVEIEQLLNVLPELEHVFVGVRA